MKDDQSSTTAQYAAAFRALESVRWPKKERLFDDPLAVEFLTPGMKRIVKWAALPFIGTVIRTYIDRKWPGAMTSGIARTRLIDDYLLSAKRDGIDQVLILGAGFDSRAYRLPHLSDCLVVEVDHPATQAHKKDVLSKNLKEIPDHVQFVAADLVTQDLRKVLDKSNLDKNNPAFILWEGVTHYLGEAAVTATLRILSDAMSPGSRLAITYLHGGLLDKTSHFHGAQASAQQVASHKEPWIWGIDPALMPEFLSEHGYAVLSDIGANECRSQYWGRHGREMRGFDFYRVALAIIK